VSDFNVKKLSVESWVLTAVNSTLRPPVLPLANVNMHDWIHGMEHATSVMGEVSVK
jgi:hypothetical protein